MLTVILVVILAVRLIAHAKRKGKLKAQDGKVLSTIPANKKWDRNGILFSFVSLMMYESYIM